MPLIVTDNVWAVSSTESEMFWLAEADAPPASDAAAVPLRDDTGSSPAVSCRPADCAGVRVQLPPPLFVPADRLASSGTPKIVTAPRVSSPSAGATVMLSAIVPPSFIEIDPGAVMIGASATGLTVKAMTCGSELAG